MGKPTQASVNTIEDELEQSSSCNPTMSSDATSTRGLTRTVSTAMSTNSQIHYKVYRRRFFGLAQLILLNIVGSWQWIALAPVSDTAATYFNTTESRINWLSTAFLLAFIVMTPSTFWVLSKRGPKASILISSAFLFTGSWIKFGGAHSNTFGVVMFGQLLIGFAQPFVLAAPTTYSDMWFSPAGRTAATAVASLANPFGAALGQLISPFWANKPSDIPWSILWVGIIASVATIPSIFLPARPPTPPAPIPDYILESTHISTHSIKHDLRTLSSSPEFWLIFLAYAVYVGFFNAFSSLLNQILEPYGFSEDDAGIAGAVLILVGLVFAAIISPLNDKYKFYIWFIRIAVPVTALMYLILIFAPPTRSIPFVYIICAIEGASSFGLVPIVLEFLVEILHPVSPSMSSALCWSGGQFLGAVFIIIMDALKAGEDADPPENMHRALIFQAVIALAVMPLPICLGLFGRKGMVRLKRWESEKTGNVADVDRDADRRDSDAVEGL